MNEQKMREALEFYAEAKRYHGPNQKHDGGDKWSLDMPYILDVTRDGGAIAREALAATAGEQVELTKREIDSLLKECIDVLHCHQRNMQKDLLTRLRAARRVIATKRGGAA